MPSLNKCMFIGNIGKIETRYMPNGAAVTNFSIAVNEKWKDQNGEKQERTEWVNCVAYRKLAEIMQEWVKVGQSVYIEGKLKTRKWEKDGITRYSTEIIADSMEMLGGGGGDKSEKGEKPRGKKAEAPPAPPPDEGGYPFDDDIPF